jgi:dihydropyrimidinase
MLAETAIGHVRDAKRRLLPIHAETCPQYLFLRSEKLQSPDFEVAKWICSPPPRHRESDFEAMWQNIANGTFTTFSSDHCPDQFDHPCGKKRGLSEEGTACFTNVPNGLPAVETRLPLLFSYAGQESHH